MKRAELVTLVKAVKAELALNGAHIQADEDGRVYDDSPVRLVIDRESGAEIYFKNGGGYGIPAGRIAIDTNLGTFHQFKPYNASYPKITVSADKSAATIAADVARRLLPDFYALLADCKQQKANADAFEARTRATAARVEAATGGRVQTHDQEYRNGQIRLYRNNSAIGYVYGYVSDEEVHFERWTLDADTAVKMLTAVFTP